MGVVLEEEEAEEEEEEEGRCLGDAGGRRVLRRGEVLSESSESLSLLLDVSCEGGGGEGC